MLTVMKFGGSSLATAEKVENAAGIIVKKAREGSDIVCVVSAQGKTTDELVKRAEEVAKAPSPRKSPAYSADWRSNRRRRHHRRLQPPDRFLYRRTCRQVCSKAGG